jgi:di/tricarboxylate transporter
MTLGAWITLMILALIVTALASTRIAPDLILLSGLAVLILAGVVSIEDGLSGMSNQGMLTVGVLYIVAKGLERAGGMQLMAPRLLGNFKSIVRSQIRIMFPVTLFSAFLNNTPVVAMFIPTISEWTKKHDLSLSKFMIPLSYAAIFGGVCTLIGTSTNLVVNGLLIDQSSHPLLGEFANGLGMFEITKIGLPCAIVGMMYVLSSGRWLLKDRVSSSRLFANPREYSIEMIVEPHSPLVGKTIEQVGLRHLKGMFLMEIERQGELLVAVSPQEKLQADDRLVFVGVVDSVIDLQKVRGLTPAPNQIFKLDVPRSKRMLIEAVVSDSFPYLGKTIRESQFRTIYNAVVIGVARNGQRIHKKVGDIIIKAGDTLLLETLPSFIDQQRNSRDFFLVSVASDAAQPHYEKAGIAFTILLGMVTIVALGWLSMLKAAMLAAGLLILTRCLTWSEARKSIDWQVLLVIIAAFGIGRALDVTGAASFISENLIGLAGDNPWLILILVYGVTSLFTELITNNAAAVLVFPIAISSAVQLGVSPMPFIIAIMVGASASFATPIGYQTNLMVYGPGGYHFSDYLRIGIPLNLLFWLMTVILAPIIWPF